MTNDPNIVQIPDPLQPVAPPPKEPAVDLVLPPELPPERTKDFRVVDVSLPGRRVGPLQLRVGSPTHWRWELYIKHDSRTARVLASAVLGLDNPAPDHPGPCSPQCTDVLREMHSWGLLDERARKLVMEPMGGLWARTAAEFPRVLKHGIKALVDRSIGEKPEKPAKVKPARPRPSAELRRARAAEKYSTARAEHLKEVLQALAAEAENLTGKLQEVGIGRMVPRDSARTAVEAALRYGKDAALHIETLREESEVQTGQIKTLMAQVANLLDLRKQDEGRIQELRNLVLRAMRAAPAATNSEGSGDV